VDQYEKQSAKKLVWLTFSQTKQYKKQTGHHRQSNRKVYKMVYFWRKKHSKKHWRI